MSRSSEATDAIHRLVAQERHREGLSGDSAPLVTDYLLIAATAGFTDDGDEVSGVFMLPEGAPYRILGLLEQARIQYQAAVLSVGEDE